MMRPTADPSVSTSAAHDASPSCDVSCVHPEAVAQARRVLPPDACVARASELLKAVADPTRLRLLAALAASELCVCDLAAVIGMSESAVSHQLRLLRDQQLVAFRREGRIAYYRLLDAHVTDLIQSAIEHAREGVSGEEASAGAPAGAALANGDAVGQERERRVGVPAFPGALPGSPSRSGPGVVSLPTV